MATYSAFFSSGLLAPRVVRCTTPVLPTSPMTITASSVEPADRQLSVTPTPPGQISSCPKAPEAHTNAERPRMRRRRSSINVGTSPMALIKSPVRNAGTALQRTGFMSPTRHRAASVSMNEASENNSLFGRLRSGSVGGVPNPTRRIRRAVRAPVPLVPPPNVPLPALPSSPTAKCSGSLSPAAILAPIPRQSFTARSSCTDDVENIYSPTFPSTALRSADYTSKMPIKLSPDLFDSHDNTIDEAMMDY